MSSNAATRLGNLCEAKQDIDLRDMWRTDPQRAQALTRRACGIAFDFSFQRLDADILAQLLAMAEEKHLAREAQALYAGEIVNPSEKKAAAHLHYRCRDAGKRMLAGRDETAFFAKEDEKTQKLVDRLLSGRAHGPTGAQITTVIVLAIGGSAMGPLLALDVLRAQGGIRVEYVTSLDGACLGEILANCDPARSFVLIASKSFITEEVQANAHMVKRWLAQKLSLPEEEVLCAMGAVTGKVQAARAFGIADAHILALHPHLGGRFSLWSSMGMPVALHAGKEAYAALCAGAAAMDRHFLETPYINNVPVIAALIDVWNRNFLDLGARVIAPYAYPLRRLCDYVQQVEMESLGKTVPGDATGRKQKTAAIVFGAPGTEAQHSFFQFLHQGTDSIPVDFIAVARPYHDLHAHHERLLAHCFAQRDALAFGGKPDERKKSCTSRFIPGNKPSSLFLLDALTPKHLGALMAFYEHKVFCLSLLWGINCFDQFGVELGKKLAPAFLALIRGTTESAPIPAHKQHVARLLQKERAVKK